MVKFVFFGGEPLSVPALNKLKNAGLMPSVIVSNPDKPSGRNLEISSPPTGKWAKENNVTLLQPEKVKEIKDTLEKESCDFFIVVSYGKIIPQEILDLPKLGTINIHPSLLPLYRGPSPIIAPILNGDEETGVTIIKIDKEMDHGPILAQEKITLQGDEMIEDLENKLADLGGEMLVKIIPEFAAGRIQEKEQDHSKATFVKKISKSDAEIKLDDNPLTNWRKHRAYHSSPRVFFFQDGKRIIVTDASLEDGKFIIKKILPEAKKEVKYEEFLKSNTSK